MTDKPIPRCPMGHEMALIQVAAGGWRYGCIRCATSFKARKSTSCGWLSPIKSTKELAREAAMKRPLHKPIPLDDILDSPFQIPCWIERKKNGMVRLVADVLDRSDYDRFFGQVDANMLEQGLVDRMTRYRADNYGKTWRCWATRPTDEERAAAKWEESYHG